MSAEATPELTIDELAQRTGMTVRNIRAHQSRGLLPAPQVRARTGYYGPEHVGRLKLIREMQAEGFNLRAIQRLLERAGDRPDAALHFKRAVLAPFGDEQAEVIEEDELRRRLGEPWDARTVRRAQRLGILRPLGKGRYEIPSPTLFRAGEDLVALGVPLRHALAVAEQINRHTGAIADAFVRLFVQDIVTPTERGGDRPADWRPVGDALARLRPLAGQAVSASFAQRMTEAVEREFGKILQR
jgi:DNA-binding transcriptional MerR regulator